MKTFYVVMRGENREPDDSYHRPPTQSEIKFGHGATHYKDFDASLCLGKEGKLKSKLKCPEDGLWYTR